jgi:hypothetical protein
MTSHLIYRGAITQLNGFEDMKELFRSLSGKKKACTGVCCMLDVEGQVDSGKGSGKVRQDTCHTNVESFSRHILK